MKKIQTALDFFSNELINVERKNHINNRLLPINKNSLKEKEYNKILKTAKNKHHKFMLFIFLFGFILGFIINIIADFIIL